jgi:P-type conjugative transfer protein TrbG
MRTLILLTALNLIGVAARSEDARPAPSPTADAIALATPSPTPDTLESIAVEASSPFPSPSPEPNPPVEKADPQFVPPPSYMPMNIPLTEEEKAGVGITKEWQANSLQAMNLRPGPDGSVQFTYGASMPSIVCAVLEVTDLQLQTGEIINGVHVGDSVRWTVESAVSGEGATQTAHLLIKPADVGLETSLVIMTNRRTYHFVLRSHQTDYMHLVSLTYPNDPPAPFVAKPTPNYDPPRDDEIRPVKNASGKAIVEKRSADSVDAHYRLSGSAPWKPVEVYNDGTKTYIEMPRGIAHMEAPSLYVIRPNGFLRASEKVMVNYRVKGHWYVVDSIFQKAILIAGVGVNQDKVTITHEGAIQ